MEQIEQDEAIASLSAIDPVFEAFAQKTQRALQEEGETLPLWRFVWMDSAEWFLTIICRIQILI